jgi:anti-sigma factor ChrR (cupin superfamily)
VLVAQSDEREELSVMSEVEGRLVVNAHTTPFLPYDLEGPVQPEMSWLPVSFDSATGQGCYLMRMEPGAITIAHDHPGMEEFLVVEGDLVDSDGTVLPQETS